MSENKPTLPAWDLSDMYKGIDDPQIAADMESYRKTAASFARKYKGRLAGLSAEEFARALEIYNKLSEMAGLLGGFAYLNMCTQMKNKEAMAFFQNTSEKLTDYGKPVIFFELELNRLPAATLKEWLKNKKVAFYKRLSCGRSGLKNMIFPRPWKKSLSRNRLRRRRRGSAFMRKRLPVWNTRLTDKNTTMPK